ncbi:MAG: hypothetical protein FWD25_10970 [Clostridia bacterium]|nr:hypothetical protein [Clostridia bacterium]
MVITMRRDYDEPPRSQAGLRAAASVMDFLGVMGCTVLILALMALMTALFSWLQNDLTVTFSGIGQNINEAVMIDSNANR